MSEKAEPKGFFAKLVPDMRTIGWVMGIVGLGFGAGVGFNEKTSALQQLPQQADSIQTQVDTLRTEVVANTGALRALQRRVEAEADENKASLRRIRCLARLSATGQVVNPLEIDDVCP